MSKERIDLSRRRQRILILYEKLEDLLKILVGREPLLRGLVYERWGKCGKKGCKCQRGELHKVICWSYPEGGKYHLRSLKGKNIPKYKRLTENYRRFRQARAKVTKLYREMMRLIEMMEQGRYTGIKHK